MKITIETEVDGPISEVWSAWITPSDITCWNFASDDWCCPTAELELKPGGKFSYRMEAKDGSTGFNFEGEFKSIEEREKIEFYLSDRRVVEVVFQESENGVLVRETFETEDLHTAEQQRDGWQSILNNFKRHVESKT